MMIPGRNKKSSRVVHRDLSTAQHQQNQGADLKKLKKLKKRFKDTHPYPHFSETEVEQVNIYWSLGINRWTYLGL